MNNINYFSKDEMSWRDQAINFIIEDELKRCWKFKLKKDMVLEEIVICIKEQFYRKNAISGKEGGGQ